MSDKLTTSKHTAGPWYNILIESATDVETQGTGGRKVASIPRSLGIAESAANARLIASAPELLATLREFCQDVQTGGPNIAEDWPDLYVTYQHAQAAIAKAEGKDRAATSGESDDRRQR